MKVNACKFFHITIWFYYRAAEVTATKYEYVNSRDVAQYVFLGVEVVLDGITEIHHTDAVPRTSRLRGCFCVQPPFTIHHCSLLYN